MPPQRKRRPPAFAAAGQRVNEERSARARKRAEEFREAYRNTLRKDPSLLRAFLKNPRDVDKLIAAGMVKIEFGGEKIPGWRTVNKLRQGYIGGVRQLDPIDRAEAAKLAQTEELAKPQDTATELNVVGEFRKLKGIHRRWSEWDVCKLVAEKFGLPPEDVQRMVTMFQMKK